MPRLKELGMDACAITDHGSLFGAVEFYNAACKGGIKPIIGFEAYVNDNAGEIEDKSKKFKDTHQIILIKNKQGFINANKLAYRSFSEGFYKKARIKTEWLIENKDGLIVTTSCIGNMIGKLLLNGNVSEAELYFKRLKDEFGEDFYAEIHFNELSIQKAYNSFLIEMAAKYKVKTIIASDVHYAYPDDVDLQDTLIAINRKQQLG
jgi:DNA polymerase-3 subunit alpha